MRKLAERSGRAGHGRRSLPMVEHEEFLVATGYTDPGRSTLPRSIEMAGYKVEFSERIFAGFAIDVSRSDGSDVARELPVRWWRKTALDRRDGKELDFRIRLLGRPLIYLAVFPMPEHRRFDAGDAIEGLSSAYSNRRAGCAYDIGDAARGGCDVSIAVPALALALSDKERKVAVNASWALGEAAEHGIDISLAVSELIGLLSLERRLMANSARALMHQYANSHDRRGMAALLQHKDPDVRTAASGVLESRLDNI